MKVYWQERRSGQRLVLSLDDESEIEVGAVRRTPRGFDALANTNTYDPGRAQKGLATMEEAKAFVESFHPWDLFGGDPDLEVEPEVLSFQTEASAPAEAESEQPVAPVAEEAVQPTTAAEASGPAEAESEQPTAPVAEEAVQPTSGAAASAPAKAESELPTGPVAEEAVQPTTVAEAPGPAAEEAVQPAAEELQPQKRGWKFWKRG